MVRKLFTGLFFIILIGVFIAFNYLMWQREGSDISVNELNSTIKDQTETINAQASELSQRVAKINELNVNINKLLDDAEERETTIADMAKSAEEASSIIDTKESLVNKLIQCADIDVIGKQPQEWIEAISNKEYVRAYAWYSKRIDDAADAMLLNEFTSFYEMNIGMMRAKSFEVVTIGIPEDMNYDVIISAVVEIIRPGSMWRLRYPEPEPEQNAGGMETNDNGMMNGGNGLNGNGSANGSGGTASGSSGSENGSSGSENGSGGTASGSGGTASGSSGMDGSNSASGGGGADGNGGSGNSANGIDDLVNGGDSASGSGGSDGNGGNNSANGGGDPVNGDNSANGGDESNGNGRLDGEAEGAGAEGTGTDGEGISPNGEQHIPEDKDLYGFLHFDEDEDDDDDDESIFRNGENQLFFLMNYKREANDWEIVSIVQKLS